MDSGRGTVRLHVDEPLAPGGVIDVSGTQAHYLINVMRLKVGDAIRLFNGQDGEWLCVIETVGRRAIRLVCREQTRTQQPAGDLHYLFAPLKQARLDYMVQKATEMGAGLIRPVLTRHTAVRQVNPRRMRANAIEAAEQCNLLTIPDIEPVAELAAVVDGWDPNRRLIFCDEAAPVASPIVALAALEPGPLAVLIGPEGGFSEEERARLRSLPHVTAISLGPRVMRADTAAVAALALVQAVLGDWR